MKPTAFTLHAMRASAQSQVQNTLAADPATYRLYEDHSNNRLVDAYMEGFVEVAHELAQQAGDQILSEWANRTWEVLPLPSTTACAVAADIWDRLVVWPNMPVKAQQACPPMLELPQAVVGKLLVRQALAELWVCDQATKLAGQDQPATLKSESALLHRIREEAMRCNSSAVSSVITTIAEWAALSS